MRLANRSAGPTTGCKDGFLTGQKTEKKLKLVVFTTQRHIGTTIAPWSDLNPKYQLTTTLGAMQRISAGSKIYCHSFSAIDLKLHRMCAAVFARK